MPDEVKTIDEYSAEKLTELAHIHLRMSDYSLKSDGHPDVKVAMAGVFAAQANTYATLALLKRTEDIGESLYDRLSQIARGQRIP